MILEAIYRGDFYPSETVVPKSEKIPERTESLREDYGPAVRKTEQRRL